MRWGHIAAGIGLALMAAFPAAAAQRIVSLNPCLDGILVDIADPDQIAALSHYSRDPESSAIAAIAQRFPYTHETAEEVIALKPDLVLASRHSSLATRNALARVGIAMALFVEPQTVGESRAQVRAMAHAIGQDARGEALVARIDQALAAAQAPPGSRPVTALMYQRNGFSAGQRTLMNDMMRRVGFINAAAGYGLSDWGNVPLETVIMAPPQVLLAGAEQPGVPTWADRVVRHPALREAALHMTIVPFPEPLIYCGGPVLIQAAAALARARDTALGEASRDGAS